jgi:hypothetical protein
MLTHLRLQNRTIATQIDFESQNQIITGRNTQDTAWHKLIEPGDFVVEENATVTLTAGNSIIFEDGTIVEDGGMLIANVTGDTTQVSCVGSQLPDYPNYYFSIEGPKTYCPGQLRDMFMLRNSGLVKRISTSWWLDNETERRESSLFQLPISMIQGGHTIYCEVSLYDELDRMFQQTQVSLAFEVLSDNDEACEQSQQKLVQEFADHLELSPNPAADKTMIEIRDIQPGIISLKLLALEGNLIKEILGGYTIESGTYKYELDVTQLKTGIYLISLESREGIENKRLIIVR